MPKQFFNIPLPNHEGLIEVQQYLKTELPEATFQDPETFHITLVHVEDSGDKDLSAIEIPYVPIFGVGGERIRVFNTVDGYAVTLAIEPTAQLIHLQALLFNKMRAMGIAVSTHSWAGLFKPHVTLARTPIESSWVDIPAMVHFQIDRFVLTAEGFEELASFPLAATTAMGEAVQEMAAIRDTLVVGEFKGSRPVVKTFPDVDIAALTAGDDDPNGGFVTLPIAKDNVVSDSKRFYSAEWVREFEKWVYEKRPIGIKGHLRDQDRSTEFPTPSIYWVGTAKVGEYLWGKGYIPPGEARDMARMKQAQRGKLATSIYGKSKATLDKQRGVWIMSTDVSGLEQIDLAPDTRAGIPELAVVPQLTKEMTGADEAPEMESENPMDKLTVIQELTADDARLLPEVVVNAIRQPAVETVQAQIAEFAKTLAVEPDAVSKRIQELIDIEGKYETVQKEQLQNLIVSTVSEFVCADVKTETDSVKAVRQTVVELVKGRNPEDEDGIKAAVKEVSEMAHVKTMIETAVVSEMGGNLRRTVKPAGSTEGKKSKYLKPRPEKAKAS